VQANGLDWKIITLCGIEVYSDISEEIAASFFRVRKSTSDGRSSGWEEKIN
jgi:hypothetical protein